MTSPQCPDILPHRGKAGPALFNPIRVPGNHQRSTAAGVTLSSILPAGHRSRLAFGQPPASPQPTSPLHPISSRLFGHPPGVIPPVQSLCYVLLREWYCPAVERMICIGTGFPARGSHNGPDRSHHKTHQLRTDKPDKTGQNGQTKRGLSPVSGRTGRIMNKG